MRELGRTVVQIPARGGSKRVPAKNLRLLCGQPLISYAIQCAQQCGRFDDIYVNTDSDEIASVAETYGAKVHRRPDRLGSDTATGDDFTAEFIERVQPDTLAMLNPVCPLLVPEDVAMAVDAFRDSDCDTLITCEQTQMQAFCDEVPVNIETSKPLAPTQQNPVVKILNFAITLWEPRSFMERYRSGRGAYIGERRFLLPIDKLRALKISHEQDFLMAEMLLQARSLAGEVASGK